MNVNHIKSRTKYLKNLNNTDIIIILCVNKDYQEENNSVKCCRRVNKLKWDIKKNIILNMEIKIFTQISFQKV